MGKSKGPIRFDSHYMLTIRRIDICDIRVMSSLASPETYSRWTTQGDGAVVALIESALVDEMLLQEWHVRQGVHAEILIICQDKDDIGFSRAGC